MFPTFVTSFQDQFTAILLNLFGTVMSALFTNLLSALFSTVVTPVLQGIAAQTGVAA